MEKVKWSEREGRERMTLDTGTSFLSFSPSHLNRNQTGANCKLQSIYFVFLSILRGWFSHRFLTHSLSCTTNKASPQVMFPSFLFLFFSLPLSSLFFSLPLFSFLLSPSLLFSHLFLLPSPFSHCLVRQGRRKTVTQKDISMIVVFVTGVSECRQEWCWWGEKRHSEGDGSTREQSNGRETRGMKEDKRK